MSWFSRIRDKIFGASAAEAAPAPAAKPAAPSPAAAASVAATARSMAAAPTAPGAAAAAAATPAMSTVDVEVVLVGLASKNPQKLNWRTSIVDLMKLLDLDSSLSARQELAQELGYTGDTNDSAAMNVWLHKQVMKKLAESGGKVPEELRS
jgi:3-oxoacyl-ACP reductase-like protein